MPSTEPANAKRIFVFVHKISVEDGFALQTQTAQLVASVEGRRVSVDEIYKLADAIAQAYANADFPLVRVVVPAQNFKTGDIRLRVVDRFVKGIDVSQLPAVDRNRAAQLLQPLIGVRHITLTEIQKQLLLVGEIPGLAGRVSTSQPDQFGGVIVTITGTSRFVAGTVGADNRLPSTIGTYELFSSFALNNALGLGEQAYISAASGYNLGKLFDGNSPWESIGGGFVLPLGDSGLNINPSYVWARTLQNPFSTVVTEDVFDRASLRANYPVLLTLKQVLQVQGVFDYINERATPTGFDFDLYRDQYSALRFAALYGYLFSWGTKLQSNAMFSEGLGGRYPSGGTPLSTPGASPQFSKLYGDLRVLQPLPQNLNFLFIGRAQTSFGAPLLLAEQFDLDGYDALSGFSAGSLPVDQGGTIRGEVSREFDAKLGSISAAFYPYLFGSAGRGNLETQNINGIQVIDAASVGIGLRNNLGFNPTPFNSSINAEFAKDFSNIPFRHDGYRGNFSVALRF